MLCQVMADMKKVYDNLIIINLYRICYLGQEDILKSNRFGRFFRIRIEIEDKI